MGKTYKRQPSKYDEDKQGGRKGKHSGHSNNRRTGGLKIIVNEHEDDDYFDDDVYMQDSIVINKYRDEAS